MTTFFKGGMRALALTAIAATAMSLTACGTVSGSGSLAIAATAKQAPPPLETDAGASTYKWKPSSAIGWRIHNGFDSRGVLRPDTPPTYAEASALAQIEGRCATDIQANIERVGWVKLREALLSTGFQTGGSLIGTMLGFENPTAGVIKQVTGLTAGTAGGASVYSADLQLRIIIDSGYAQCVLETVKKEPALLGRMVVFGLPLQTWAPAKPLAPGVSEPIRDDMDAASGVAPKD